MTTSFEHTKICVILPAHNEGELIGGVIRSLPEWVSAIVVVDDVSSDDTCAVVEALGDPRVTLVRHTENTGVGGAMASGYRAALELDCDILVKMDADGQMAPSDLPRLVRPLVNGAAEYTKGNRFYVVNANRSMPKTRKFGSVILTFMTKMSSGYWHVFDSQCGFTAMQAHLLKMVDLDAIAKDYFFENDMLIWLNTVDARVVDVPIKTLYGDEVSDVRIGKVMWSFPPRLVRGWLFRVGPQVPAHGLRRNRGTWYLRHRACRLRHGLRDLPLGSFECDRRRLDDRDGDDRGAPPHRGNPVPAPGVPHGGLELPRRQRDAPLHPRAHRHGRHRLAAAGRADGPTYCAMTTARRW